MLTAGAAAVCRKTSLIRRYTEGFFTPNYKLTIGVDFAVKLRGAALGRRRTLDSASPLRVTSWGWVGVCGSSEAQEIFWDTSTQISLQLWDVAGHERCARLPVHPPPPLPSFSSKRFGTMTRVYYRYAIAAVIVFDVSRVSCCGPAAPPCAHFSLPARHL